MKIDTSDFDRATKALDKLAQDNARAFGESVGRAFETKAKRGASWTDRTGQARRNMFGRAEGSGAHVRVRMGGSAPNYKAGARSYKDYLEILEFGMGKEYAIVYPTFEGIREDAVEQYGKNAIKGGGVCVYRDKAALRRRNAKRRHR